MDIGVIIILIKEMNKDLINLRTKMSLFRLNEN